MTTIIPGTEVPALDVPLVGVGRWTLAERARERFTVIGFYRGLHCPRCARRLEIAFEAGFPDTACSGSIRP